MLKGFKTKLNPNNEQRTKFAQHAGVSRWTYNWGLNICHQILDARSQAKALGKAIPKFPTAIDLHKRLNAEIKPEHEWFYQSSKCAPQQALRDLDNAWKRRMNVKGSNSPRRKKKFVNDHFYLEGSIQIKSGFIQLPRIGLVRLHEEIADQKLKNVTVSRKASDWSVSFKIEFEPVAVQQGFGKVGVDVGIKTLAILSDGTVFPSLKPYKANKNKLKVLQRQLARQVSCGKNRDKTKQKIALLHARIANIRNDATHKLTSYLTKNHSEVVIEDLNVSGMMKNHCLAGAIADSGFYEFRRQLEYKASWYGSIVMVIDRFYPSSKLCSHCGNIQPMPLHLRQYDCSNCGLSLVRDLNAAINIRNYSETAASSAVEACGRDLPGGPVEAGSERQLETLKFE